MTWDLTVTTAEQDGVTVVTVRGPVDCYSCDTLRKEVTPAASAGPLVVDLTRCDFLDSTGLGVLARALKASGKAGHKMALVVDQAAERVTNVLRVTGLNKVFAVYDSLDGAVAAISEEKAYE